MKLSNMTEFGWKVPEGEGADKERRRVLEDKLKFVDSLYTDYLEAGKEHVGIDPELRQGIAVLLAAEFETEASCWGHPERLNQPGALVAEQNLLPYIAFTGYKTTDGLDEKGRPNGYTEAQVNQACFRMTTDAGDLSKLLTDFYAARNQELSSGKLQLSYMDGMPGGRLITRGSSEIEDMSAHDQNQIIDQAREEWAAFLKFVEKTYLAGEL